MEFNEHFCCRFLAGRQWRAKGVPVRVCGGWKSTQNPRQSYGESVDPSWRLYPGTSHTLFSGLEETRKMHVVQILTQKESPAIRNKIPYYIFKRKISSRYPIHFEWWEEKNNSMVKEDFFQITKRDWAEKFREIRHTVALKLLSRPYAAPLQPHDPLPPWMGDWAEWVQWADWVNAITQTHLHFTSSFRDLQHVEKWEIYFFSVQCDQCGTKKELFHFHSRDQSFTSEYRKVPFWCTDRDRTEKSKFPIFQHAENLWMKSWNARVSV